VVRDDLIDLAVLIVLVHIGPGIQTSFNQDGSAFLGHFDQIFSLIVPCNYFQVNRLVLPLAGFVFESLVVRQGKPQYRSAFGGVLELKFLRDSSAHEDLVQAR